MWVGRTEVEPVRSGPGVDADTHVGAGTGEVESLYGTVERQLRADQFGDRQLTGCDHWRDGVEAVESAGRGADNVPFVVMHIVGRDGQIGVGSESGEH